MDEKVSMSHNFNLYLYRRKKIPTTLIVSAIRNRFTSTYQRVSEIKVLQFVLIPNKKTEFFPVLVADRNTMDQNYEPTLEEWEEITQRLFSKVEELELLMAEVEKDLARFRNAREEWQKFHMAWKEEYFQTQRQSA